MGRSSPLQSFLYLSFLLWCVELCVASPRSWNSTGQEQTLSGQAGGYVGGKSEMSTQSYPASTSVTTHLTQSSEAHQPSSSLHASSASHSFGAQKSSLHYHGIGIMPTSSYQVSSLSRHSSLSFHSPQLSTTQHYPSGSKGSSGPPSPTISRPFSSSRPSSLLRPLGASSSAPVPSSTSSFSRQPASTSFQQVSSSNPSYLSRPTSPQSHLSQPSPSSRPPPRSYPAAFSRLSAASQSSPIPKLSTPSQAGSANSTRPLHSYQPSRPQPSGYLPTSSFAAPHNVSMGGVPQTGHHMPTRTGAKVAPSPAITLPPDEVAWRRHPKCRHSSLEWERKNGDSSKTNPFQCASRCIMSWWYVTVGYWPQSDQNTECVADFLPGYTSENLPHLGKMSAANSANIPLPYATNAKGGPAITPGAASDLARRNLRNATGTAHASDPLITQPPVSPEDYKFPYVYLTYPLVFATDEFGQRGGIYTSLTWSFLPEQVSSVAGQYANITSRINFADLPCPPQSVIDNLPQRIAYTKGVPYQPLIAPVPQLWELDPAFEGCVGFPNPDPFKTLTSLDSLPVAEPTDGGRHHKASKTKAAIPKAKVTHPPKETKQPTTTPQAATADPTEAPLKTLKSLPAEAKPTPETHHTAAKEPPHSPPKKEPDSPPKKDPPHHSSKKTEPKAKETVKHDKPASSPDDSKASAGPAFMETPADSPKPQRTGSSGRQGTGQSGGHHSNPSKPVPPKKGSSGSEPPKQPSKPEGGQQNPPDNRPSEQAPPKSGGRIPFEKPPPSAPGKSSGNDNGDHSAPPAPQAQITHASNPKGPAKSQPGPHSKAPAGSPPPPPAESQLPAGSPPPTDFQPPAGSHPAASQPHGSQPPAQQPTGSQAPGPQLPGKQPAGSQAPGQQQQQQQPTGSQPAASQPADSQPAGSQPAGAPPPGQTGGAPAATGGSGAETWSNTAYPATALPEVTAGADQPAPSSGQPTANGSTGTGPAATGANGAQTSAPQLSGSAYPLQPASVKPSSFATGVSAPPRGSGSGSGSGSPTTGGGFSAGGSAAPTAVAPTVIGGGGAATGGVGGATGGSGSVPSGSASSGSGQKGAASRLGAGWSCAVAVLVAGAVML